MTTAAVVIARNEGERLRRCLHSITGNVSQVVYVDSGSTDGSIKLAEDFGATVINLDMSVPFTAARARNIGVASFEQDPPEYIQLIDGDCELCEEWLPAAVAFLDENPGVAAVAGRLRERFPDATVWNRLADAEWSAPSGETEAVAGTALLRREAIKGGNGFREDLIAGEEPEMCLRLRQAGWKIWRIDVDMAHHDLDMTHFWQWWKRMSRSGHAFAEVSAIHWGEKERFYQRETLRTLVWGVCLPVVTILGAFVLSPWFLLLLLLWPAQILRLIVIRKMPLYQAFFLTLARFPEAEGVFRYWVRRFTGNKARLIEYKGRP